MNEIYGKIRSDQLALENENARKMLREMNQRGLSDRQRWFLIYLLGLELTNIEEMQTVAGFVKTMRPDAVSISAALEADEKTHQE
jgi:hypothetical protein